MGRTKKIHDLYSVVLHFRVSKSQYDFISSYCSKMNMSLSEYIRKHIDKLISESR